MQSEALVSDYISEERPRSRSRFDERDSYVSREQSYIDDRDRGDQYSDYSDIDSRDVVSDRDAYSDGEPVAAGYVSDRRTRITRDMSRDAESHYESEPRGTSYISERPQDTEYEDSRGLTEYRSEPVLSSLPPEDEKAYSSQTPSSTYLDSDNERDLSTLGEQSEGSISDYVSEEKPRTQTEFSEGDSYVSRGQSSVVDRDQYADSGSRDILSDREVYSDAEPAAAGYASDRGTRGTDVMSRDAESYYESEPRGDSYMSERPQETEYEDNRGLTEYQSEPVRSSLPPEDERSYRSRTPSSTYVDSDYERDLSTPGEQSGAPVSDYVSEEQPRTQTELREDDSYVSKERSYTDDGDGGDQYSDTDVRSRDVVSDGEVYSDAGPLAAASLSERRTPVTEDMSRDVESYYESEPHGDSYISERPEGTEYEESRELTEYQSEPVSGSLPPEDEPPYSPSRTPSLTPVDSDYTSTPEVQSEAPLSDHMSEERALTQDELGESDSYVSRESHADDGDAGDLYSDRTDVGSRDIASDGETVAAGYVSDRRTPITDDMSKGAESFYESEPPGSSHISEHPEESGYEGSRGLTEDQSEPIRSSLRPEDEVTYSPSEEFYDELLSKERSIGSEPPVSDRGVSDTNAVTELVEDYDSAGERGLTSPPRSEVLEEDGQLTTSYTPGSESELEPVSEAKSVLVSEEPRASTDADREVTLSEHESTALSTGAQGELGSDGVSAMQSSSPERTTHYSEVNEPSESASQLVLSPSFDSESLQGTRTPEGQSDYTSDDYRLSSGVVESEPARSMLPSEGERVASLSASEARVGSASLSDQASHESYASREPLSPSSEMESHERVSGLYPSDGVTNSAVPRSSDYSLYALSSPVDGETMRGTRHSETEMRSGYGDPDDRSSSVINSGVSREYSSIEDRGLTEPTRRAGSLLGTNERWPSSESMPQRSESWSEAERYTAPYASEQRSAPARDLGSEQASYTPSYATGDRSTQYSEPYGPVPERAPSETRSNSRLSPVRSPSEAYSPQPLSPSLEGGSVRGTKYPEEQSEHSRSYGYTASRISSDIRESGPPRSGPWSEGASSHASEARFSSAHSADYSPALSASRGYSSRPQSPSVESRSIQDTRSPNGESRYDRSDDHFPNSEPSISRYGSEPQVTGEQVSDKTSFAPSYSSGERHAGSLNTETPDASVSEARSQGERFVSPYGSEAPLSPTRSPASVVASDMRSYTLEDRSTRYSESYEPISQRDPSEARTGSRYSPIPTASNGYSSTPSPSREGGSTRGTGYSEGQSDDASGDHGNSEISSSIRASEAARSEPLSEGGRVTSPYASEARISSAPLSDPAGYESYVSKDRFSPSSDRESHERVSERHLSDNPTNSATSRSSEYASRPLTSPVDGETMRGSQYSETERGTALDSPDDQLSSRISSEVPREYSSVGDRAGTQPRSEFLSGTNERLSSGGSVSQRSELLSEGERQTSPYASEQQSAAAEGFGSDRASDMRSLSPEERTTRYSEVDEPYDSASREPLSPYSDRESQERISERYPSDNYNNSAVSGNSTNAPSPLSSPIDNGTMRRTQYSDRGSGNGSPDDYLSNKISSVAPAEYSSTGNQDLSGSPRQSGVLSEYTSGRPSSVRSYTPEDRVTRYSEPYEPVSDRYPSETRGNSRYSSVRSVTEAPEAYSPQPLSPSLEGGSVRGTGYSEGQPGYGGSDGYVPNRISSGFRGSDPPRSDRWTEGRSTSPNASEAWLSSAPASNRDSYAQSNTLESRVPSYSPVRSDSQGYSPRPLSPIADGGSFRGTTYPEAESRYNRSDDYLPDSDRFTSRNGSEPQMTPERISDRASFMPSNAAGDRITRYSDIEEPYTPVSDHFSPYNSRDPAVTPPSESYQASPVEDGSARGTGYNGSDNYVPSQFTSDVGRSEPARSEVWSQGERFTSPYGSEASFSPTQQPLSDRGSYVRSYASGDRITPVSERFPSETGDGLRYSSHRSASEGYSSRPLSPSFADEATRGTRYPEGHYDGSDGFTPSRISSGFRESEPVRSELWSEGGRLTSPYASEARFSSAPLSDRVSYPQNYTPEDRVSSYPPVRSASRGYSPRPLSPSFDGGSMRGTNYPQGQPGYGGSDAYFSSNDRFTPGYGSEQEVGSDGRRFTRSYVPEDRFSTYASNEGPYDQLSERFSRGNNTVISPTSEGYVPEPLASPVESGNMRGTEYPEEQYGYNGSGVDQLTSTYNTDSRLTPEQEFGSERTSYSPSQTPGDRVTDNEEPYIPASERYPSETGDKLNYSSTSDVYTPLTSSADGGGTRRTRYPDEQSGFFGSDGDVPSRISSGIGKSGMPSDFLLCVQS